jgi:hypothetical protein
MTLAPSARLLLFGLLAGTLGSAPAQTRKSEGPTARFTVWGSWEGQELFVENPKSSRNGEHHLKLDLLDLGYSAEIPFERSEPIELCTRLEQDGETLWQPLIRVTVPIGIRDPLVMIFPGEEEASPSYQVFDLDPSVFPYGSYQLVNLTKVRLFAKLDETGILLPPGEQGQFEPEGSSKLNVWLRVAAEDREKNGRIIYSSMMKNRPDKRMFMFFHPSDPSAENPFAVRTLVDFAPARPDS